MKTRYTFPVNTLKRGILLLIFVLCTVIFAKAQNRPFTFATGAAININDIQWSIAGNPQGKSPNILSELIFKKITSIGIYFEGAYKPLKYLELIGYYQRNAVVAGKGTDADYQGDNRTNATYHEPFSSNKGQLKILKAGANYYLLYQDNVQLKSGIAYTCNLQDFHILNADFDNLNSTYKAKWQSAGLSFSVGYKICEKLFVEGRFSYSLIRYNAAADWNLIEIFAHPVSFAQQAKGYGTDGEVSLKYRLNSLFTLTCSGTGGNTKTATGVDQSYLQNGTQILTQFNGANNKLYGFKLGMSIAF